MRTPASSTSATASPPSSRWSRTTTPSFIEPYQGAATGVGGILRDVFTMAPAPWPTSTPSASAAPTTRAPPSLLRGVVAGVRRLRQLHRRPHRRRRALLRPRLRRQRAGQRLHLRRRPHRSHLLRAGDRRSATRSSTWAAKTGRDGIHGAHHGLRRVLRRRPQPAPHRAGRRPLHGEAPSSRPAWRSSPRTSSSASRTWARPASPPPPWRWPVAAAAASTSTSTASPAAPRRLAPYEMLLSESQERMLLVAQPGKEPRVMEICKKWELDAGHHRPRHRHRPLGHPRHPRLRSPLGRAHRPAPVVVCDLPVDFLTDAAPQVRPPAEGRPPPSPPRPPRLRFPRRSPTRPRGATRSSPSPAPPTSAPAAGSGGSTITSSAAAPCAPRSDAGVVPRPPASATARRSTSSSPSAPTATVASASSTPARRRPWPSPRPAATWCARVESPSG